MRVTASAASAPRQVFVPPEPGVSPRFSCGTPVLEASGPRVAPAFSVRGALGLGHLPYTQTRKSQTNADLHRGDSFVLQRRAITTADRGSEMEEQEEELGPDAAAEPPAAPCTLRGGGVGGRGHGRGRRRPRALPAASPRQLTSSHPGRSPGAAQATRVRARGEGAAEADSGPAPHQPPGAASRQTAREPARRSSVRSAVPWSACLGSRPALRRTCRVSGPGSPHRSRGERQRQSMRERANGTRWIPLRAGWGRIGRLGVAVGAPSGWSEAGSVEFPLPCPYLPPLNPGAEIGVSGRQFERPRRRGSAERVPGLRRTPGARAAPGRAQWGAPPVRVGAAGSGLTARGCSEWPCPAGADLGGREVEYARGEGGWRFLQHSRISLNAFPHPS